MSRLLQSLVRITRGLSEVPIPKPASVSLVSRVSSLNIAPVTHNALTSSRLCARLSHVSIFFPDNSGKYYWDIMMCFCR